MEKLNENFKKEVRKYKKDQIRTEKYSNCDFKNAPEGLNSILDDTQEI